MNDPFVRSLRWQLLAYGGRWYRDGIYKSAQQAAGSRSVPELLRNIERDGPQTIDEKALLSEVLLALADGHDVLKALRIDRRKVGHKEASPLNAHIVYEIDTLIGEGEEKSTAIALVANVLGREPGAVDKIYQRHKDKS